METTVKKKINHDSMWIEAKFPSGASYKFKIDRNGERLEMAFSNNDVEARTQMNIFGAYMKFKKGETNENRFNRLERLTKQCKSGKELINLMQNG